MLQRILEVAGSRLGIHIVLVIQHRHSCRPLNGDCDRIAVTCARLGHDQITALAADPAMDVSPEWLSEARAHGDACFGVFVNDRLVAYDWRATRSPVGMTDGLSVHFDDTDSCYGFKMFTHPEFRGHGLQASNFQFAEERLLDQGIHRTIGYVDLANRSSYRVSKKTGGTAVGWVAYCSVGPLFFRVRSPGARRAGFDITRKSRVVRA